MRKKYESREKVTMANGHSLLVPVLHRKQKRKFHRNTL